MENTFTNRTNIETKTKPETKVKEEAKTSMEKSFIKAEETLIEIISKELLKGGFSHTDDIFKKLKDLTTTLNIEVKKSIDLEKTEIKKTSDFEKLKETKKQERSSRYKL